MRLLFGMIALVIAACGSTAAVVPANTAVPTAAPTPVPPDTPSVTREWLIEGVKQSGPDGDETVVTIRYFSTASVTVTLDSREVDERTFESPVEHFTFRGVERGTHTAVAQDMMGFEETMVFTVGPASGPGAATPVFAVMSDAFADGEGISVQYTCDGYDVSPSLAWSGVPPGTETLAVIMDDPDAPRGTWNHWVVFNIPADVRGLEEAQPDTPQLLNGGVHGKNSWGKAEYGGPCPPRGPAHNYRFFLYAVDITLELPAGASKKDVLAAIDGHIVGESLLTGTFGR